MVWCPQCQISMKRFGAHQRGILHRKHKLLRALLADDQLTFREIARRTGVSAERVRQVAEMVGAKPGHVRRKGATLARLQVPTHIARVIRRAQQAGLEASPLLTKDHQVISRELSIEGQRVAVSHLWQNPRLAAYVIRVRPWCGARFVVYYADDFPEVLVVPVAQVRPTAVVMGRERKIKLRESRMLRYLDAWHLLKRRKLRRKESRSM